MDHMDDMDRIRQRAHEIWEAEGRPEGRDRDHWQQAEQELHEPVLVSDNPDDGLPEEAPPREADDSIKGEDDDGPVLAGLQPRT